MKNLGRILSLALVLVVLSVSVAFAGTFNISGTYPEDGEKNVSLENMGVKIYTDSTFTSEKLGNSNDSAVQIYGPEGEKVPTRVYYSSNEPSMLLVLADKDEDGKVFAAISDSEYKLEISSSLKDDSGNTLGKDLVINMHTVNQKRNNTINTVMMFVLFGGIMVFSLRSAKKNAEKEANNKGKAQTNTVNPYKEAKKTGKSVSEIVEKDKADKEKAAAKAAKAAEKAAKKAALEEEEDELEEGHYRVKTRRSALAAGSAYATEKKAKHDARREQEAKWAAQAKKKSKKK